MACKSQDRLNELTFISGDILPEGDDVLEFRLLYQGQLLGASRNNTRNEHKHQLRKEFHKQLKRLWETKSPLKERLEPSLIRKQLNEANYPVATDVLFSYRDQLAEKFNYHGYKFVPIVTEELFLTCSLEILFLRPEEGGLLIEGGDIDNRVKTVFDSLRMPTIDESFLLKDKWPPSEDEVPMYCLMKDDKLVSEVKVTADHLLFLPGATNITANDVFMVVYVKVKPTRVQVGALDFL